MCFLLVVHWWQSHPLQEGSGVLLSGQHPPSLPSTLRWVDVGRCHKVCGKWYLNDVTDLQGCVNAKCSLWVQSLLLSSLCRKTPQADTFTYYERSERSKTNLKELYQDQNIKVGVSAPPKGLKWVSSPVFFKSVFSSLSSLHTLTCFLFVPQSDQNTWECLLQCHLQKCSTFHRCRCL